MNAIDRLDFRSYRAETERHAHGFWQVVLPVEGRLDMEIGGRGGAVCAGQGALIPPGIDHAFEASGENRFLVADVSSVPLGEAEAERFAVEAFFPVSSPVKALVDYRAATEISREAVGHWCALFLAALSSGSDAPQPGEAGLLARAVAHMEANLAGTITIEALCRVSGLQPHRLTRAFRLVHGESPYAFLTGLRLREARRLLRKTGLPLAEIAARTGFADQSAMTRHMRRKGWPSPAAYRLAHRAPPHRSP